MESLAEEGTTWDSDRRSMLLELLLGVANLSEYGHRSYSWPSVLTEGYPSGMSLATTCLCAPPLRSILKKLDGPGGSRSLLRQAGRRTRRAAAD